MRAEIISIGDELTTGQRLDTNSQWLAERLLEIGVPVAFHTTVGDQLADNVLVFRQACERADIVVVTGGLGPTADDLTRQALADVAGVELIQDDASLVHIKALFARRKREMPPSNIVQAQFPQGSRAIFNPNGSAPGIDISISRAVGNPARVFALPGVPAEMKEMWAATVGPAIQEHIGVKKVIAHHRIKCFGVGESDLEAMLPDIIARNRYPLVGITVSQATITLRITAEGETVEAARAAMQPTIDTIHQCLGDLIFGYEDDELQDVVVRLLNVKHKTLIVDEWATGGLVALWLAQCESNGVFRIGEVHTNVDWWKESGCIRTSGVDFHLVIGPPNESRNVVVNLIAGDQNLRKEFAFVGHPEILQPRLAKAALNLLRLHLLGKGVNLEQVATTPQQAADQRAIKKLTITAPRKEDDREPDKRPLDLRLITRLIGYMRPYATKRNWLFLMVVLRSIQLPLVAWSIGAVIDGPIAHDAPLSSILWGAFGVLAIAFSTQIVFHFRQRLSLELGEAVIHDLRQQIFEHLMRMPMSFYNKTKIGRIISRVTSDCESLRVGVQDVLFVGLVGVGQMLVAGLIMFYYDWALFSIVVAMSPVLWGLNRYFRRKLSVGYRVVQESFSRLTATLAESINGVRVTQAYVRHETNSELFKELLDWHGGNVMKAVRLEGALMPLLELNSQTFIAAILLVGGYRVLSPEIQMPPGDLIRFFFLANIFFSPIQILGNQYNQALTAMAGAERVFGLLDRQPEWSDAPDAYEIPPIRGRVEFAHITFGYDPDRPVLHDIEFAAEPGQTIALVGRTGSGKSSIINLIARFYLPQQGQVLIDGHDTRGISGQSLHHQMGIVWQQNFLFTGTIKDNIRVGKPDATDEEVVEAARQLDCLDLLEALPLGLDTQVGERGASLSLGQRQLVCFVRAMLANPRILILDEATSSVDTLTEIRIQTALAKLLAGRTSFVVAHRLSTIRSADRILVLENGRIIQRGTHAELLAASGEYAHLLEQFSRGVAA